MYLQRPSSIYSQIQDALTRKHFANWLADAKADPTPKSLMFAARRLTMDLSLRVFCGPHISDEAADEINEQYWLITRALELVNFPLAFPGTKVYKAIQARKAAIKWLSLAASRSKASMAAGNEPECMLDAWVRELSDPSYKGRKDFDDREMAMVLFSFLFASQDALSSAVIYGFQHLADHPDILAKVREEQEQIRAGNVERPLSLEMVDNMPYLRAFVKESLRVKPPVTMVSRTK
jgi:C-22 sterol desaturase